MGTIFSTQEPNNNDETNNDEIDKFKRIIEEQNIKIQKLTAEKSLNDNLIKQLNQAKQNKDYEYLVLSGGGVKGISYCGALQTLEELEVFNSDKIKGFAGTSAGSIMACLLAIGYSPNDITNIMMGLDFKSFLDKDVCYFGEAYDMVEKYGLCEGKKIYNIMGELIEKKTGNADYTLDQLYAEKNIILVIVVTNLTLQNSEYICPTQIQGTMSPETSSMSLPNHLRDKFKGISIRTAVRISMSIPFLFEPYKLGDDLYVDGGVIDNYPIHVFDGDYPGDPKARLNLCPPNPKVLGLNIFTETEMDTLSVKYRYDLSSLWKYSCSYISLFLINNEKHFVTPSFWERTVNIVTKYYPLDDFSLTEAQKMELFADGKKYVNQFFSE